MSETEFLILAATLFGLMLGSFANVCVHRIPQGLSVVTPRSRCPACNASIAWYDNIPVLSWLILRGKCRHCGAPISIRYPILELAMGISWGALAWHFGPTPELVVALVLVGLLWILTLIDLETFLLPDVLTLPGIVIGFLLNFWVGDPVSSLIGAVAGYGLFWSVAKVFLLLTGREGMGYGDFKLLAMLGAFLGWQALPLIILLSSFTGAIIGSVFLLLSRKGIRAEIPFGPYLALAGVVTMLWGGDLMQWYFGLVQGGA